MAASIRSWDLVGRELLNVCISARLDKSLAHIVEAVSRYREGTTDYVVFGFHLRDALQRGALLYRDEQAVLIGAYMLALPAGTRLRARVLKRHRSG